jgi:hypothetical protein
VRPSLPVALRERRALGRERRRKASAGGERRGRRHSASAEVVVARHDVAASKVREAGGPIDEASYACTCGMVFAAAVSTSVRCPHCGSAQAW